ncbi:hypothetical protein DYB36_008072 [Aphanomyces astaci]|uniref:DOMON domain-containing protein n=1 Tax=Aphanomyces astaci TaxID=112090 RepID=A0A397BAU1_APHAT|nr:hypothetical protein DYB36_008072 [Aphanomyces astaci]
MFVFMAVAMAAVVVAGVGNTTTTTNSSSSSGCADDLFFALQPAFVLGPMSMRTFVKGPTMCAQVTFPNAAATVRWVAVGFAKTAYMVNNPVTNVVVLNAATAITSLHLMQSYESVPVQPGVPSILQTQGSVTSGGAISFTFERPLASSTPFDVALDPAAMTNVLWGYGTYTWPAKHIECGDVQVTLASSTIVVKSVAYTPITPAIIVVTFAVMMGFGLLSTYETTWRRWSQAAVIAPSKRASPFRANPLKVGEAVVVLVYVGGGVVVCSNVYTTFIDHSELHRWSLALGHLALQSLAFLLLPVARGQHWELVFGTSHERLLKFHRWLGLFCVVTSTAHLVLSVANRVTVATVEPYGSQEAVPLFGLLAYVAFASMALLAFEPIRRAMYEVFYYYHRVASVVGLCFVMLHSSTVQFTMLFPLIVYGVSALGRVSAYWNHHDAAIAVDGSTSVVVTLPATAQTTKWATEVHPCAFFWVNVPAISLLQWHPFTAIITRDGKSISFCMKSMGAGGFVDRVVLHAATVQTLGVLVGGPYGKPSIELETFDVLVMVAGGVGITPILSVINRFSQTTTGTRTLHLFWVVRSAQDLLVAEGLMFPLPENVRATFYVSQAREDGTVRCRRSSDSVTYVHGKPVMGDIINNTRYLSVNATSVGVLACGPPSLVQEAQWFSHACGFAFHKEGFAF